VALAEEKAAMAQLESMEQVPADELKAEIH
jgi:hypothetical protein